MFEGLLKGCQTSKIRYDDHLSITSIYLLHLSIYLLHLLINSHF